MIKTKTAALVFLLMLAMTIAIPPVGPVQAAGPKEFTAPGFAWIASEPVGFPAGHSDRFVTTEETVMALLGPSNWEAVSEAFLNVTHASNAMFELDANGLITRVLNGTSHGKFTVNGVHEGSYRTKISTSDSCQILDSGTWTIGSGSLQGHGTLTVCLNFGYFPLLNTYTYWGTADMQGKYNP